MSDRGKTFSFVDCIRIGQNKLGAVLRVTGTPFHRSSGRSLQIALVNTQNVSVNRIVDSS
jgi:hypothetical protein